ncbi:steroid hormone receptor ERR2-like isoform X2 [Anopheles stephensi]|uniref:steroid hormone receptor ERR2-like isoform X2 n=2 Tax=Anopheles stephensi TaxID=30069 RepID=UPI0016589A83|nr:steroid hormone receptor ERR2-like isoform X2 [Anopheles stephensi]
MDTWMQEVVSMMAGDGTSARIKQELIETSCCSPSPSSVGSLSQTNILYGNSPTGKMDFKCSSNNNDTHLTELHGSGGGGAGGSSGNGKPQSPGSPDRQFCSSTTSAIGDFGSDGTNHDTIKEELPRRLCLVCGDVASGFHYGVASCEACKAFFKRTIQGNIEYTCPASNDCEINKRRRKACQACRFRKCLLMGMLKEGVRLDRVRGGRQKYRRNPCSNPYQMQIIQSNQQYTAQTLEDIKILEVLSSFEPDPLSIGGGSDMVATGEERNGTGQTSSSSFSSASSSSSSTSSTGSNSPGATAAAADSGLDRMVMGSDAQEILSVLSDIYDKELVGVIGWAKQIPGFTDLPLNDQMRLLQVSWAELLTLMLAYRSIPFDGRLYFATDFWLDERSAKECGALDLYNHLAQITQRLEKISATKEEYYLLKALSLSNCDIRLDNYSALKKIRDSILYALNDCVLLIRQHQAVSHQQQLLLLLPSLRQADHIIRKFWTNVHIEGNVTMNKLFVEMLESVSR